MNLVAEKIDKIKIKFPDGNSKEFPKGVTPLQIAKSLSNSLAKAIVAAKFNGKMIDLDKSLNGDGDIELHKTDGREGLEVLWHSTAHLMAQAIKRIWPDAKIAIGPTIETGFYYDIDLEKKLTNDDLLVIEKEMKKVSKENHKIVSDLISAKDAKVYFNGINESYKIEIIDSIDPDEQLSIYKQGEFTDLCRGPHVPSTGKIKHFKLMSLAGAYWRGDENNKMLQRIYGVSFPKEEELSEYLELIEEAKKRDHRKLGKELDLFSFQAEAPGFVFWHGRGVVIYNEIVDYWRSVHTREGYQELKTPIILNDELWKKSGHWDNYKENMYFTEIDDASYAIKPMNCPGGLLVYKNTMYSYRDFPLKLGELGLVHRHEKSGVLHGLLRVRQFTQDDAHIYCTPEQIKVQVQEVVNLVFEIYNTFGFKDIAVELSTKPEKAIGSAEIWDYSEKVLAEALDDLKLDYVINEGDGAFYGPKIDFHIKDSLKRTWQCGTIQLDFSMPERLGATYIDKNGEKSTPVMIHRAILGSLERFIGILIEHYGGDFPFWLAPEQVVIIPVSEKHHEFAGKIYDELKKSQIRVRFDNRNEKVGYKIREYELLKIPYMCVVGDKEMESGEISIRQRFKKDIESKSINGFIEDLNEKRRKKL